jgi:FixJ family two-component response regulator
MTSPDTPTVFIVDDDGRMRAAMQRLLKTVGLHSELFATPGDSCGIFPDTPLGIGWRILEIRKPLRAPSTDV